MRHRATLSGLAMSMLWIVFSCFATAQDDVLSLKHGTYVLATSECHDPSFAAMKSWDGVGFSGPHSSKCVSRVLSHHGDEFNIRTSCAALGDGSAVESGFVETFSLMRLSNVRFVIANESRLKRTYRWCRGE